MSEKRKFFLILLLISVLATVGFIFYNSTLPPTDSQEQSSAVWDIISGIIPPDSELFLFLKIYLRKIAHFTEYGLLGIELALIAFFFAKRKPTAALFSFFSALSVSVADESIQVFSGRGASVVDVWIDVGGFVFFFVLSFTVLFLARFIHRIRERIKYAP